MERRPLKFSCLSEAVTDVEDLQAGGYERAGNWSLEQVLDHLNKTLEMAFNGPPFKVPFFMRPLLKMFLLPKMKRGDVIRFRASAPGPVAPEDSPELESVFMQFRDLTEKIESPDATFVDFHPLFGNITRDEWVLMQRWHAAHHLSFLISKQAPQASTS